jgi:aminobenzoyl-glutamate utilization protein B
MSIGQVRASVDLDHVVELARIVDGHAPEFVEMADAIWDEPELRWTERSAMEKQITASEAHGFEVRRNVAGIPTAFVAEHGHGGPVIAFLGEYDALAGLSQGSGLTHREPNQNAESDAGHGCGHHQLGSGSLLAAVATAQFLIASGLPGTVRYYGCPAEEAAAGKSYMVKAGAFHDVSAALIWHPYPTMVTRQMRFLAYIQFYVRFRGIASHAGVSPELGRSALDAAELMNVGVNFLREHMAESSRIHYALTDSGGRSPNVVQEYAESYYLVRAEDLSGVRELYARVVDVARGAALMTGTRVDFEFDGGSANVLPNRVLEHVLHGTVEALGGVPFTDEDDAAARKFVDMYPVAEVERHRLRGGLSADASESLLRTVPPLHLQPSTLERGSTDVGDVSWVTPTVQLYNPCMAFGTPAHTWQWVAQGKMPAAHKGMIHAAKALAATASQLFREPDLISRAVDEHAALIAKAPFESPIPDGAVPPPLRRTNSQNKEVPS